MYIALLILGLVLAAIGLAGVIKKGDAEEVAADKLVTETLPEEPVTAVGDEPEMVSDSVATMTVTMTEQEQKGQAFEEWVINHFSNKQYVLVEKVNDYTSREHTAERSKYTDFVFRDKVTNTEFGVECKYRSHWSWNKDPKYPYIEWASEEKIKDYEEFAQQRNMDVIIILGVGGEASNPENVYALPLRALKYPSAKKGYLDHHIAKLENGSFVYISKQHTLETVR